MHTLSLFTLSTFSLRLHSDYLVIFCSDCVLGPCWGTVRLHIWQSGREIDGIFLDGVFDQCAAQTKVTLLPRWGCLSVPETGKKRRKRKKGWGRRTLYHTLTSCPWPQFCLSNSNLSILAQIPENKRAWWHGERSSRGSYCNCLWTILAPVGNANNFQRPQ